MQNVSTVDNIIYELQSVLEPGSSSFDDFQKLFDVYLQYQDDLTDEVSYNILKRFVQSSNNDNPYKQLANIIKEEVKISKNLEVDVPLVVEPAAKREDKVNYHLTGSVYETSISGYETEKDNLIKEYQLEDRVNKNGANRGNGRLWHDNPIFYTNLTDERTQAIPQNIRQIWNNDSQRVNLNIHAQPFVPTQNSYRQNTQGSNFHQGKPSLGRQ